MVGETVDMLPAQQTPLSEAEVSQAVHDPLLASPWNLEQQEDFAVYYYTIFAAMVRQIARSFNNVIDEVETEDVVQEVLLKIIAKPPAEIAVETPLRAYIRTVTEHYCIDLLRKRQWRRTTATDLQTQESLLGSCNPIQQADALLSANNILAFLKKRFDTRLVHGRGLRVLVLTEMYGYSIEEAAQALQVKVGTAKSSKSHLMHQIRQLVAAEVLET